MRLHNSRGFSIKFFGILCFVFLSPRVLLAQDAPDGYVLPDLLILRYQRSLEMQRYLPSNWENLSESYPSRSYPVPGVVSLPSTEGPMKRTKVRPLFIYSMEIKNTGSKVIAGVVWEYVFIDRGNDNEFERLQFRNRMKVAVNETAILTGKSLTPPHFPKVTNVRELEKEGDTPYLERPEIKCVLYADGTWWKHPKVIESDCESLISVKKHRHR